MIAETLLQAVFLYHKNTLLFLSIEHLRMMNIFSFSEKQLLFTK